MTVNRSRGTKHVAKLKGNTTEIGAIRASTFLSGGLAIIQVRQTETRKKVHLSRMRRSKHRAITPL